jgi:hypothetical protein
LVNANDALAGGMGIRRGTEWRSRRHRERATGAARGAAELDTSRVIMNDGCPTGQDHRPERGPTRFTTS